ncbi:MAG: DUF302 domain-containing protein [Chloroflexi bacterium]|nr:DUF302 domain-containing protein [Chloroflexota bacterium]
MLPFQSDITIKNSRRSVDATVQRLTTLIAERGMTIFATIDQTAAARGVGLDLRDTVLVLFGSPAAGTPVMETVPLAGLDLPLKVLVWDDEGQTRVSYLSPTALSARYGLTPSLAAPLAGIDHLTDVLVGP